MVGAGGWRVRGASRHPHSIICSRPGSQRDLRPEESGLPRAQRRDADVGEDSSEACLRGAPLRLRPLDQVLAGAWSSHPRGPGVPGAVCLLGPEEELGQKDREREGVCLKSCLSVPMFVPQNEHHASHVHRRP